MCIVFVYGEYQRKSFKYDSICKDDGNEVIVSMYCNKCKEKVEELGKVEGMESVYCNQKNDWVIVTRSNIDTNKSLMKVVKVVKKKCTLTSNDSNDDEDRKYNSGC